GASHPMMSTESGGTWSTATQPGQPSGSAEAFVDGVSCEATGSCLAVGGYWTGSEERPMAIAQTGGTWSAATGMTTTPSLQDAWAEAVSCPAVGSCVAVGTSNDTTKAIAFSEIAGESQTGEEEVPSDGSGSAETHANSQPTSAPGTTSGSTGSTRNHDGQVPACIRKANASYKNAIKAASHKKGKARSKALKAAKKKKAKAASTCGA